MESIETIIVGAGQAGLATSYHLKQLGRQHASVLGVALLICLWCVISPTFSAFIALTT